MNPKFARLLLALSLAGGSLVEPGSGLFAEGDDDGGGGGGGGGGERKFSQDDLDKAVSARLAREQKAFEKKLADATKAGDDKSAALQAQLEELTAKLEDAGKNDAQKELAKLQRDLQKAQQQLETLTKERDEAARGRDEAIAKHKDHLVSTKLTEALLAAKVLPNATAAAVREFKANAQVDLDDDGTVTVTLGKRVYDDVGKAASDFLESAPYFKAHPGGGAGTRNNASGGRGSAADDEMDERVLLGEAARSMVKQHTSGSAFGLDKD